MLNLVNSMQRYKTTNCLIQEIGEWWMGLTVSFGWSTPLPVTFNGWDHSFFGSSCQFRMFNFLDTTYARPRFLKIRHQPLRPGECIPPFDLAFHWSINYQQLFFFNTNRGGDTVKQRKIRLIEQPYKTSINLSLEHPADTITERALWWV